MKLTAVMSIPRLGWNDFWGHVPVMLTQRGIGIKAVVGAYWGQTLQNAMQDVLRDGAEGIIVLDYDALFKIEDLDSLLRLIHAYPEADAIIPMQMGRNGQGLIVVRNDPPVSASEMLREMIPVDYGHFGMTFLRGSALQSMSLPWLQHAANDDGEYKEGKIDDDVYFWRKFRDEGKRPYLATRIVLGHMELMVKFPDKELNALYQPIGDYHKFGKPSAVWA